MPFDAEESRYNRQNRINQPDFAPGQAAEDPFGNQGFNSSDPFGGQTDPFGGQFNNNDPFGNQGFNSPDPFAGQAGFGNNFGADPFANNVGYPQQTQQQTMTDEDKFWQAAGKAGKGTVNFMKDFTSSFSKVTPLYWTNYGSTVTKVSVVVIVLGIIGRLFGLANGLSIAIGACLSAAVGVSCWFFPQEKAKVCTSKYKEDNSAQTPSEQPQSAPVENFFNDDAWSSSDGFTDSTDFSLDMDSSDDEADEEEEEEEEDWASYAEKPVETEVVAPVSTEEALASFEVVDKGMYTRQYLFDTFTKVLPMMKPDFATMIDVDPDDDEFLQWGDRLIESAQASGHNEEFLPELQRLQKGLLTMTLTCNRPKGFKPDAVAEELAQIYRHLDGVHADGVYVKSEVVGMSCTFTLFTGKSAMISLKDMMLKQKDFILDSSNYIPLVFGIDQMGKVIVADAKKLESIIITGMPRSGKSWFVQAILTQMCAFVPPSELNIFICDPKEGISDFKGFTLPHVKKFVSKDAKIVDTLRKLVKEEGPRRKKIIGDAGFVNIWDYKERYPDVKLPIIYVVVDEIVTLASRMDKDTNNEFRMLLRELISQLPALGIRAFLIPHVLNNDIIEKKTSDLVPCKISVCGDADHIEKATGSKPKDFPYKLTNKGDMAVRMPLVSSNTMYIHAPALTDSNVKNNELFDYLRRVWSKLEPEEVVGSLATTGEEDQTTRDALESVKADNDASIDTGFKTSEDTSTSSVFTNTNESGLSGFSESVVNSYDPFEEDDGSYDEL